MRTLLLAAAALALTGCVSERAALVNDQGQVVRCDQWGFGLLGAPVAMAGHSACMKQANQDGYHEMGRAVPVPEVKPTPVTGGNPNAH